ncbi:hypothetical protein T11_14364 [Trichinella zimbabwensis]|uniref:Uncharacterized protein n=1 Tax=Trichinella zimbabwensis TaxID=268475 RepID=A0A0V1GJ50_9BILA|nr:hypothetical protein T11_14364 [Trichinella zimbabwensis]
MVENIFSILTVVFRRCFSKKIKKGFWLRRKPAGLAILPTCSPPLPYDLDFWLLSLEYFLSDAPTFS